MTNNYIPDYSCTKFLTTAKYVKYDKAPWNCQYLGTVSGFFDWAFFEKNGHTKTSQILLFFWKSTSLFYCHKAFSRSQARQNRPSNCSWMRLSNVKITLRACLVTHVHRFLTNGLERYWLSTIVAGRPTQYSSSTASSLMQLLRSTCALCWRKMNCYQFCQSQIHL